MGEVIENAHDYGGLGDEGNQLHAAAAASAGAASMPAKHAPAHPPTTGSVQKREPERFSRQPYSRR